jgi:hypothetical protein
VCQVCFASGGASPPRAGMARTARLGKGVRREAESEESRCPNSDSTNRNRIQGQRRRATRHETGTPDSHSVDDEGKSGERRVKDAELTLGDLSFRSDNPDYRGGNVVGQCERSQQRP